MQDTLEAKDKGTYVLHVRMEDSLHLALDEYRWTNRVSLTKAVNDLITKGLEASQRKNKK